MLIFSSFYHYCSKIPVFFMNSSYLPLRCCFWLLAYSIFLLYSSIIALSKSAFKFCIDCMGNVLPFSFCRIFLRHTYKSFSVPCLDHMKLLDCQYVLQTNGNICLKCIASLYRIYTQIVIQLFLSPTALCCGQAFFVTLVAKKYRLATMLPFAPRMVCDSR